MLSIMLMLFAAVGFSQFIIITVVLGGLCYLAFASKLPEFFKTAIYVVCGIIVFILALKLILPMAGI